MVKSKHTTIRHIAEQAGVSISTVSNVLNGNTDEMSAETFMRVQEIIERLNYRPNQIARGLVTRRTATIGLVVVEIETPLFLQALSAIERDARAAGYNILLAHARGAREEQEALALLMDKQVEGVIMLPTSEFKDDFDLKPLRAAQMPAVFVNQAMRHPDFDQINWDNRGGIIDAVDHLVALGHTRIANLRGPANRKGTQDRLEGYQHSLQKHGIAFREDYVADGDYTAAPDLWQASTRKLLSLSEPPTAILASDDTVAAVVIETVREAGLSVPGDLSVVGIDDQPFLSFLSLTTIRLPVYEAGKLAIEMLLQRISSPQNEVRHVLLPCPFIARKTTGQAPTRY